MKRASIACSFGLAALAAGARAQQPVDEVVVTADFRESQLMQRPGSVTVVDEVAIRDRAAEHLEDVLALSPNVEYSSGASRARFVQIRGVGDLEQFVDPKHYPSVGVAIDDIDLGATANAAMLYDVAQVEILRGPQGTRFGTTALAGLVNLRGNRPTETFEARVDAGVAEYGSWELGGVVSGPLSDGAGARLAVHHTSGDGYIDNVYLGRADTNGYEETSMRATFDFDAGDRADYGVTAMYFDGDNGYDAFSLDNTRETLSDQPGHDRQDVAAIAARGEWSVGSLKLVGSVSRLDSEIDYGFDEDWTYVGICDGTLCDPVLDFFSNTDRYVRDREQTSVDLRLVSEPGAGPATLSYVLGVYAENRDEDLRREYFGDFASAYSTERRAFYGHVRLDPVDTVSLTLGLRYEDFGDDYSDSRALASASDDELGTGEITASWWAGERSMLYLTLARGEKPGGVNTEASSSLPFMQPQFQDFVGPRLIFDAETLWNREIGLKGTYLGGRLDLRAALFDMDRDNAQLESWIWDSVNFLWVGFLDNADASNRGVELELDYAVGDRVGLFASAGYLDTEVRALTTFDLDLDDFVVRDGIEQAKAPSWQYNVGFDWDFATGWHARVEVEGQDDNRFGYYHDSRIDGYTLLHASLRYRIGRTELQLWGRNLTDDDYAVHGLFFGNDPRKGWVNEPYYQLGKPRTVGLSARYAF